MVNVEVSLAFVPAYRLQVTDRSHHPKRRDETSLPPFGGMNGNHMHDTMYWNGLNNVLRSGSVISVMSSTLIQSAFENSASHKFLNLIIQSHHSRKLMLF